jgi:nucleotide-binding universal stress UspA family protein
MDEAPLIDAPFVDSVFHPSDFSAASENAFAHALALALVRKTTFTILHTDESRYDWQKFPAVRTTLERWGVLQPDSPRSAVFKQLAVRIKKVGLKSRTPLEAILHYLDKHPTDLIVLATEGRSGVPRWLQPSMAERIAERSRTMTLFVPEQSRGFVSSKDGTLALQRILVPVDQRPSPLPALEYTARIAGTLGTPVKITLLHVGDPVPLPGSLMPQIPGCSWQQEHRQGEVVDELIKAAREHRADLIVMTTAGHEGILDALRGSVTQQVLRHAPCPLLAIPEKVLLQQGAPG